jgi:hypothetical protein
MTSVSALQSTDSSNAGLRQLFFERAEVELKRAERYRVFVSLIVLDVSVIQRITQLSTEDIVREVETLTRRMVRACDYVSLCGETCLVALFPETSRQGAEIAGRRLGESVRERLSELTGGAVDEVVPLEMASYPDAAGARSVATLLHDLAHKNRN